MTPEPTTALVPVTAPVRVSVLQPQPEPALGMVTIASRPHPFSDFTYTREVRAGMTLAEIVDITIPEPWLRRYAAVAIEGHLILPQHLPRVRPKAGRSVTVTCVPMGGGGEGGGKNTTAAILSVVVLIAATAATAYAGGIGGYLSGGALAGAGAKGLGLAVIAATSITSTLGTNTLMPARSAR